MIKVAHLTSVHPWDDTRILQRMCRSLADAGYDTHLVVPTAESFAERQVHGVQLHCVPLPASRRERFMTTICAVRQTAAALKADIYHFHDPELMRTGLALRRQAQVIYDAHENVATDILIKPWIPRPLRGLVASAAAQAEAYGCRRMSGIVAAGEDIAERLRSYRVDVECIQNYPDLRGFRPPEQPANADPTRQRFLFLGGVDASSLPFDVSAAIAMLPDLYSPLVVWGGKRCLQHRMAELQQTAGWRRVDYVGYIQFEDLRRYLYGATAALILYHNAPFCHRIRSNRLFESMACGVPVIVPSFGEWPAFVDRYGCGLAVDPHQPAQLAAAMLRLMQEPALRIEMGRRGRDAVLTHFSWQHEFAKLDRLYRRLMNGQGEVATSTKAKSTGPGE